MGEKKNALPRLSRILLILIPVIVIGAVLFLYREARTARVDGGLYTYFGEEKNEYQGKTTLSRSKDGITTMKNAQESTNLGSRPLYNGSDDEILLPVPYIWVDQEKSSMYRLEAFSTVTLDNGRVILDDDGLTAEGAQGFLFDGNGTYIFLEPAVVTCGEESYRVDSLSFAVIQYGRDMNLYASKSGKAQVISLEGVEAFAELDRGGRLDLSTNKFYRANGSWMLLITEPEMVSRME